MKKVKTLMLLYLCAMVKPGYESNQIHHTQKQLSCDYTSYYSNPWFEIASSLSRNDNQIVLAQESKLSSHTKAINILLKRATPYIGYILREIREKKIPKQVALIPIIESAFKVSSLSKANAKGIWQITQITAKHYGLRIDKHYDGRLDIIASTDTALSILKDLYERLNKDWLLAYAAYNCGYKCVSSVIKQRQKEGQPIDFWSIRSVLPKETRFYVPRILALSNIIYDHNKYKIRLPHTTLGKELTKVEIKHLISLNQISKMIGLPANDLIAFNPAYREHKDLSGTQILLPRDKLYSLQKSLFFLDAYPESVTFRRSKVTDLMDIAS